MEICSMRYMYVAHLLQYLIIVFIVFLQIQLMILVKCLSKNLRVCVHSRKARYTLVSQFCPLQFKQSYPSFRINAPINTSKEFLGLVFCSTLKALSQVLKLVWHVLCVQISTGSVQIFFFIFRTDKTIASCLIDIIFFSFDGLSPL